MKKQFADDMKLLRQQLKEEFNAELRAARETATDAQADNLALTAEVVKLRAQHNEGDTPEDVTPRPMDVDMNRSGGSTLQEGVLQPRQELETPPQQALIRYRGPVNDDEDVENRMQGGDDDGERADDEGEGHGGDHQDEDVDMQETQAILQPASPQANPTGRRPIPTSQVRIGLPSQWLLKTYIMPRFHALSSSVALAEGQVQ